ncbi:MAG: PQQ-binding-like beta-propeller repeat protein [Planctomycetaceae bacterium]
MQNLLDAPHDGFLEAGDAHSGVREAAGDFLRNAPESLRRFYATAQERRATAALDEAIAARDLTRLGEVVRRFPTTGAAALAADRLARIAFDRGDFGTAARLWERLLTERLEAGDASPALASKTIAALRRAGREHRASEMTERFATSAIRVGGRSTTVRSLPRHSDRWTISLPTTAIPCTAASGLTPPAFPATWRHAADPSELLLTELWAGARQSENRPVATPAAAVIVAGRLFVREPSALVSYDLRTGRRLWQAALSASSEREIAAPNSRPGRLRELTRFEESYAGNSALAAISTDGEHVFVVERADDQDVLIQTVSHSPLPEQHTGSDDAGTNRLLAYPAHSTADSVPEPAWMAGGKTNRSGAATLEGHYFFGSPVASAGRLLAITEERQCLYLVALNPATGELLWKQPLGFVTRPVADDRLRAASMCPPAVADGIAVCATNSGFVVAVDFVTGRLLWAYEYAAETSDGRGGNASPVDRTVHRGEPAFPSIPLVRDDRVILLPQDSGQIHCLDLTTGAVHWTAPREDAISVACLTDSSAVVLGRSSIRSLSDVDGRSLWVTRLGAPAGTGVVTDSVYLLPLETGTIVAIDLESGRPVGFDSPRDASTFRPLDDRMRDTDMPPRWRPGNLCTDGRSLVSVGPFGVMRLETVGAELARNDSARDRLETARLELAAGLLEPARERLESVGIGIGDESSRREAARLLRELHYLELDDETPLARQKALIALDGLSITPTERGRFLLNATANRFHTSETDTLRRRMSELAALNLDAPLAAPHDATHLVSVASWLHALTKQLPADVESLSRPEQFLAAAGEAELQARLLCLPEGRQAADVRVELARRALDDAEFHQAEMLLLQAMLHDEGRENARRVMDRLRSRCGFARNADFAPTGIDVGSVRITGKLWSPADEALCETFQQPRRCFLSRGRNPFRVVDLGDTRSARLAVVDLQRGVRLGEVAVDARLRFPAPGRQPLDTHFVPVVTADRVYGLSYLEARNGTPAWEADLAGNSGFPPQIGPYGPSFCAVQTRSDLTVLDSATGKTLWRRTELPANRRFAGQHSTELFGDDVALVLLDVEGAHYTVYDTRTGNELSQGRLPISVLRQSEAIGRKFFYVETRENRSIAHLWDPATGEDDLEIAFTSSLLETTTRGGHLVLLFGDGDLLVVDPHDVRQSIRLKIDPGLASQVGSIQAFSDGERHYVSLSIADPDRFADGVSTQYVYDTPLAMSHVQGRLIAIDKASEAMLWSRPTGPQSILDPVDHPFPFLVGLARVTDRRERTRKTLLVEAIDPKTGATLGRNSELIPDRLLQARYEPDDDRVVLAGMTSTIELKIEREGFDDGLASAVPPASKGVVPDRP